MPDRQNRAAPRIENLNQPPVKKPIPNQPLAGTNHHDHLQQENGGEPSPADNTIQRTERGKTERRQDDETVAGEPTVQHQSGSRINTSRDKGIEPAADDRQRGTRGEAARDRHIGK